MATYRVEVRAEAREIYYVDADSEADALSNWERGILDYSEAMNGEAVSAELAEDE